MITWVSAGVFAAVLLGMWFWVEFRRRHAHVGRQRRTNREGGS